MEANYALVLIVADAPKPPATPPLSDRNGIASDPPGGPFRRHPAPTEVEPALARSARAPPWSAQTVEGE